MKISINMWKPKEKDCARPETTKAAAVATLSIKPNPKTAMNRLYRNFLVPI
jgi:hypothetical protein